MVLKIFNSMGNKVEEFVPLKKGFVGMYTCGPTIYNYIHIGNFKCYSWEDLVKRYLLFKGFKVKQVMNFTDVDDKTIRASIQNKMALSEYTQPFKKAFLADVKLLNILPAEIYCSATEHIPEMVVLVKKLLDKGLAYKGEDASIYFSIKKFPAYGKLAGIDTKKLKDGARVKQDEYEKEGVGDFALWKAWDENDGAVFWETSLGKGRPGWHIECSAMSEKYLGKHFDLHMGGVDNKFPHHENEIAQSDGANGGVFVKYWMHCEHLLVDGKKMSKSLKNFYTLRDLVEKGFSPLAVRYVFINSHYRQQLNFTFESVGDAQKTLLGLKNFISRLREIKINKKDDSFKLFIDESMNGFTEAMDNDFNVPQAMKYVFDFIKKVNKLIDASEIGESGAIEALEFLKKINSVVGVLDFEEKYFELTSEQEDLVEERDKARKTKDWKRSDEIRDLLKSQGIEVIDNKEGTVSARPMKK
ncbi:MAG: cysteine--tRNA ligase [Candidatus Diapherotrites archaeon]|nr:cysteine--tRNA ligase [Candidatus Diapherotrites archaeon]